MNPSQPAALLEAKRLSKSYAGLPAVDDVSFSIAPGEILGYLGPNGSGKSTTVKMLTGLIEPTSGGLLYRFRDIREDMVPFNRILGYVPEELLLYSSVTGREYLQLTGRLRCLPEKALDAKIDAMLDL